jgi:cold shock CspA family protein
MPEGTITSYDADAATGRITSDEGDSALAFDRKDVVDRRTGEQLRSGQHVTFEVEADRATNVRRVAPRGYGA